jgi:hypothetical protein
MKTTKMSLANIQGKLSRTEMKNIMAGSGGGGNCQNHGDRCATHEELNCCSGLICADYKCAYVTLKA